MAIDKGDTPNPEASKEVYVAVPVRSDEQADWGRWREWGQSWKCLGSGFNRVPENGEEWKGRSMFRTWTTVHLITSQP